MSASAINNVRPEQPWFVFNAARHYSIMASQNPEISHYYCFEAAQTPQPTLAMPDGCVDVIFDCDSHAPVAGVYGTPLEARTFDLKPGHRYFGARFAPGVVPDFLHLDASSMINGEFLLGDVVADCGGVIEQIVAPETAFPCQVQIFDRCFTRRNNQGRAPITRALIKIIQQRNGNIRVDDMAALSGYTCRTIQRQFRQDTGLTPKAFCRIIRCQWALKSLLGGPQGQSFSELALELGFYDQSHFLSEFKRLTSVTPLNYQRLIDGAVFHDRIRYTPENPL